MTGDGDHREHIREEVQRLRTGGFIGADRPGPVTSDLSIDEALILHSVGWEPVELVCGVGTWSIPAGTWQWAAGELGPVVLAHDRAFSAAASALVGDSQHSGGHGVIGMRLEVELGRRHVNVVMVGTAVAPIGSRPLLGRPWVSDLSGRDFALLHQAGWDPVGMAYGASFVYAPRRSLTTTVRQKGQNVELTNYTEALYSARESAMERMQSAARALGARQPLGVVGVQVSEGPVRWASHVIGFTAWGTTVRRSERESVLPPVEMVLPVDDRVRMFEAASLRND